MRYFSVTPSGDGARPMKLFYKSLEECRSYWAECDISEIKLDDATYRHKIQNITKEFELQSHYYDPGTKWTNYFYINRSPKNKILDKVEAVIFFDEEQEAWVNSVRYRLHNSARHVEPFLWSFGSVDEVYDYICGDIGLKICCMKFRSKPDQIKGLKPVGSVILENGGKRGCPCQVYLKEGKVFIVCNDFFSPSLRSEDEIGAPVGVVAERLGLVKRQKFVYDDNWGDIVARRCALIEVSGVTESMDHASVCRRVTELFQQLLMQYGRVLSDCEEAVWKRFFEDVFRIAMGGVSK